MTMIMKIIHNGIINEGNIMIFMFKFFSNVYYLLIRREDSAEQTPSSGGMCQSLIRYARPQKARSASGDWKFIVNTGQHTQTLRLEKCK